MKGNAMETGMVYEKFGGLLKEETLTCIDNSVLLPDTCVLESVNPFSGYYNEVPGADKPLYLYLVLEGNCSFEKTLRATAGIKKHFRFPFDAAPGSITLPGGNHQVIRIRNLQEFGHIAMLQKAFLDEGMQFIRKTRKVEKVEALIHLTKFFYLEPIGEMMFLDRSQAHHGYFIIPRFVDWNDFKDLTREVKFDAGLQIFDAATACYFENHTIFEMVRIYRENLNLEMLAAIRQRYLRLMS